MDLEKLLREAKEDADFLKDLKLVFDFVHLFDGCGLDATQAHGFIVGLKRCGLALEDGEYPDTHEGDTAIVEAFRAHCNRFGLSEINGMVLATQLLACFGVDIFDDETESE